MSGGLNGRNNSIFSNLHFNNNNGLNNHQSQCDGPADKLPPELFAISFTERMRRHSTMSHKIVIKKNLNCNL